MESYYNLQSSQTLHNYYYKTKFANPRYLKKSRIPRDRVIELSYRFEI